MRSMVGSFSFIFFSKQLQGSNEGWNEKAQQSVDSTDMPELVGVCKMATVPGKQEVALVVRRQRQVKRITGYGFDSFSKSSYPSCTSFARLGSKVTTRRRSCPSCAFASRYRRWTSKSKRSA